MLAGTYLASIWQTLTSMCPSKAVEGLNPKPYNQMGDCKNYGPFVGPYYNTGPNLGDPKRDHNFDNLPNSNLHSLPQKLQESPVFLPHNFYITGLYAV